MSSIGGAVEDCETGSFSIDDRVYVGNSTDRIGKVVFIGETKFSAGQWIGVVLNSPTGKNDGSVGGISYFKCKPLHGIFSKCQNLRLVPATVSESTNPNSPKNMRPSSILGSKIGLTESVIKSTGDAVSVSGRDSRQRLFNLGDRVRASGGRVGTLRFLGPTEFAAGEWAGIELDEPLGKNDGAVGGKRTSQESLLSYCSNMSSVSHSFRPQYGPNRQGITATPASRRPTVPSSTGSKEESANIHALQRLIREKEEHINQLLEERDIERSDLARVTLDREASEAEAIQHHSEVERLNQQLHDMEAAYRLIQEEHEQLQGRLHEERKTLEDLQFRMEEEHIDKSVIESITGEDDSKVFELEEALMMARETNERTEAELTRVREQLAVISAQQALPATDNSKTDAEPVKPSDSAGETHEGVPCGVQTDEVAVVVDDKPGSSDQTNNSAHEELEKLRMELVEQTEETELALKRQADALQVVSADYEKQLAELNASLVTASKELITFREETTAAKSEIEQVKADLQNDIDCLKAKLAEEDAKSQELLTCSRNQIAELTATLETEKNKTSTTVLEQALALRKLEEKLQVTERKLMDYQSTVLSSAEACVAEKADLVASLEVPDEKEAKLLEQLQAEQDELRAQLAELTAVRQERDSAMTAQQASDDKVQQLEAHLHSLRLELAESERMQESMSESLRVASTTRDQLVSELTGVLKELSSTETDTVSASNGDDVSVDGLSRNLRSRIDLLSQRISESETNGLNLESRIEVLQAERAELDRELIIAKAAAPKPQDQTKEEDLVEELENTRSQMSSLEANTAATLKELESKSTELHAIQEQLDQTLHERTQLQQSHNQAMSVLETEKQQLMQRINKAETGHSQSPAPDTRENGDHVSQLIQQKASADSQINFLNSIIVDLHKKNAELEERVRTMLTGMDVTPRKLNGKTASMQPPPPRLWCDNCLLFDSHETENCPTGQTHAGTGVRVPRKRLSHQDYEEQTRVYCSNCCVFDSHATENCTEIETF